MNSMKPVKDSALYLIQVFKHIFSNTMWWIIIAWFPLQKQDSMVLAVAITDVCMTTGDFWSCFADINKGTCSADIACRHQTETWDNFLWQRIWRLKSDVGIMIWITRIPRMGYQSQHKRLSMLNAFHRILKVSHKLKSYWINVITTHC